MRLKKVEMQGFKSFAKEITLEFKSDITAILGPNGSGKSNIADAIKWVLGEQSAKSLRGNKMEDVIFAGSSDRKQMETAEVTLTLDNSDGQLPIEYNEVTISRRVSRSGNSDYLINNSICRLKDIEELIMGTGLGKEAYSIIGQGKIDQILSSKATERRGIFEEAAGITKHKERKREATRKLDKTKQDLQRITDILNELENRLGPLEKEAKKAEEYQEYYGELEELEVNLLLNRYSEVKEELTTLSDQQDKLAKKVEQTDSQLTNSNTKLEELNLNLAEREEEIDYHKEDIYQAKRKIEQINNKVELIKEKRNNSTYRIEELEREINTLESEVEELVTEQDKQQKQLTAVKEKLTAKEQELTTKQEELAVVETKLEEKLEFRNQAEDNKLEQLNSINDRQYRLESIADQLAAKEEEESKKEQQLTELKVKISDLQSEKEELVAEIEQLEEKLTTQRNIVTNYEEDKKQLQSKLQELQEEFDQLQSQYSNYKSKLEVLEDMQQKHQGYYRGVKNVLQYHQDNPDFAQIYGVVAELLEVPEKFETAVETALGSRLQNIVVAGDQDAKAAINYLKEQSQGRATFLPLNLVSSRDLRQREQQSLELDGALGVAAKLVDYDQQFRPVVQNLLGRIIIARDIDAAVSISKACKQRVKVVTLEGEVVNPGGSMTGGSSNNKSANLLGRSRKIEELTTQVEETKSELEEIKEEGIVTKEKLVKLEDELEDKREQVHQLDLELTSKKKDHQQLITELERLENNKTELSEQLDQLAAGIKDLHKQREHLKEELSTLSDGSNDLEGKISSIDQEIDDLEAQQKEINQKLTDLKVKSASLEQERDNLAKSQKRIKSELEKNRSAITEKESEIEQLVKKKEQLADQKVNLLEQKEEAQAKQQQLETKLDSLQQDKQELITCKKEVKESTAEIRKKLEQLQSKLNDYEVKATRLEMKLENVEEKLAEEYQVEVATKLADREPIANYQQVEDRISELKSAIEELGHVNLGAIAEYETLQDRFSFMQEQHQDLIEARDSLQTVIDKIDRTMKEKFKSAFAEIKVEFEEIFSELFGGGQASLKLQEPDNLLETGIEINAQPPGKKLQKLSLMSGGEKALTAIALLFALLKVRPSPFYILDEIDAPLDDANVDRFAEFLEEFSSLAQFIVITHRKGTMQVADALYGVAMQESGISKLVSVNLEELAS
ncbi:MAG: chromosome segregation protein SMC [Bacillota bacterium]